MRPKEPLSEASVRGVTSLQIPIFSSSTTPAESVPSVCAGALWGTPLSSGVCAEQPNSPSVKAPARSRESTCFFMRKILLSYSDAA